MTTTITVTTHAWPVIAVSTDEQHLHQTSANVEQVVNTTTEITEVVPPQSTKTFYVSQTQSIEFFEGELPDDRDATVQ